MKRKPIMRIKYLHQLLISHMTPLLVAFLIISFSFTQFIENLVYENKVEELVVYGKEIASLSDERLPMANGFISLRNYSDLLDARNIHFIFFNEKGSVNYHQSKVPPNLKLSQSEWEKIQDGKTVEVKRDIKRFNQEVSLVAIPLKDQGVFRGGIMLTSPITGTEKMISTINQSLFYIVLLTIAITIMISWFLSTFHVKRIQILRDGTSKVASGDYDVSVPASHHDEIGELSRDFNQMVIRLKTSNEQIERLENLRRQFIADVSHELRTPLTTIKGIVEGLKNNVIPEKEKEKGIDLMQSETKRLIRLVNENLDYERIRSDQITLQKVDLSVEELLEMIEEHLSPLAEKQGNQMRVKVEEAITVFADYDRIVQILINITKNSLQFTEGGIIQLSGKRGYRQTIIEIEDNGIGMSTDEIHSMWERFYKADISRRSLPYGEFGLGLSIVKKLVELHDGNIVVDSEKGRGTRFTLSFPDKIHS